VIFKEVLLMANKTKSSSNQMTAGSILARFITSAIILAITAFFTPGFEISSFWTLVLAAVVLTIMDYLINMVIGIDASPFGRGIIGFVVSVLILYATQFFVSGYSISWVSAIVGALIYGIIASIVPGKQSL
jgi:putative membrane protein